MSKRFMNPFLEPGIEVGCTVRELFEAEKIDLDFLEQLEDISTYWQGCVNFITEVWQRRPDSLSEKQTDCLEKILEDCIEKRIEGKHGRA